MMVVDLLRMSIVSFQSNAMVFNGVNKYNGINFHGVWNCYGLHPRTNLASFEASNCVMWKHLLKSLSSISDNCLPSTELDSKAPTRGSSPISRRHWLTSATDKLLRSDGTSSGVFNLQVESGALLDFENGAGFVHWTGDMRPEGGGCGYFIDLGVEASSGGWGEVCPDVEKVEELFGLTCGLLITFCFRGNGESFESGSSVRFLKTLSSILAVSLSSDSHPDPLSNFFIRCENFFFCGRFCCGEGLSLTTISSTFFILSNIPLNLSLRWKSSSSESVSRYSKLCTCWEDIELNFVWYPSSKQSWLPPPSKSGRKTPSTTPPRIQFTELHRLPPPRNRAGKLLQPELHRLPLSLVLPRSITMLGLSAMFPLFFPWLFTFTAGGFDTFFQGFFSDSTRFLSFNLPFSMWVFPPFFSTSRGFTGSLPVSNWHTIGKNFPFAFFVSIVEVLHLTTGEDVVLDDGWITRSDTRSPSGFRSVSSNITAVFS